MKDQKPEIVLFYNGCDLCNLTPVSDIFLDIFAEYSWYPKPYYLNVKNKTRFIKDYYNNLKVITGKPHLKVIKAMMLGYKKFLLFEYLNKVFYLIRPVIKDFNTGETKYSDFFKKIVDASTFLEYKKIQKEINELLCLYPPNHNLMHIGLAGDPYTLMEPYAHQYTDRKLGYLGVIVDRWRNNKLIKRKKSNPIVLKDFIKDDYGVLTTNEIKKINEYAAKVYNGIVFISPFACNPNDALRNQLSVIQEKSGMPVLSLVFDSHTSPTGIQSRLESFVELISRKV